MHVCMFGGTSLSLSLPSVLLSFSLYVHIHTCLGTYVPTYFICTYVHTVHMYKRTYIHACKHACIATIFGFGLLRLWLRSQLCVTVLQAAVIPKSATGFFVFFSMRSFVLCCTWSLSSPEFAVLDAARRTK